MSFMRLILWIFFLIKHSCDIYSNDNFINAQFIIKLMNTKDYHSTALVKTQTHKNELEIVQRSWK